MKKVIALSLTLTIFAMGILSIPISSEAKLLPRHQGTGKTAKAPISTKSYSGVSVSPSFMPGKSGLKVAFGGVNNAKKVSYMLVYETNGKQEGLSGSISPSDGSSVTRNLQFATCSSGTCVNHGKIKNMKLTVTSELNSGKKSIKKFNVKV